MTQKRIWSLLHSTAAYYPVEAKQGDQQNIVNYMEGIMDFVLVDSKQSYNFGSRFLMYMNANNSMNKLSPEDHLKSNASFAEWLCVQHNLFNLEKLAPKSKLHELSREE